jgi:hypothetical protein
MTPAYRSSPPPSCVSPKPHTDASQRLHTHGPIQPMDENTTPTLSRWGLFVLLVIVPIGMLVVERLS